MDTKEINPLWNLADTFSVADAVALIAGFDSQEGAQEETNVKIVFSSLVNAIDARKLKATIRQDARAAGINERVNTGEEIRMMTPVENVLNSNFMKVNVIFRKEPDWQKTTIDRQDLIEWLEGRGVRTGFFFPGAVDGPAYLDPKNPRYSAKLAAAVMAWQAVTDPRGRSPKQALTKWLNEHATRFGLTDEEGKPVRNTIEEISKIANWEMTGGAPKTLG
jgi:hypothetical protein